MLEKDLESLNLPELLKMNDGTICNSSEKWEIRRKEIVDMFSREVYGYMPQPPTDTKYEIVNTFENAVAGFANYYRIRISFTTPSGPFYFDADMYFPTRVKKAPVILHFQFNDSKLFRVYPVEDIIKNGFATILVKYWDIMPDRNDFTQGLAGMYLKDKDNRDDTEWGAIGCWAFAASRVMDVIEMMGFVDSKRVAFVGHSRLGKTAMWCAANDTRISLAVINASGNSGAALSRGNEGESVDFITKTFPHWFCKNYYKYGSDVNHMPFDQHEILAAIAPRKIYVSSGNFDLWAAPKSEFLGALAASPAYEINNLKGLITPDEYPDAGTFLSDGAIAYSLHEGTHYIGRFEWDNVMSLMKKAESQYSINEIQ